MAIAGLIVSPLALGIALVSIGLAIRADKRAQRAECREEADFSAPRQGGDPIVTLRGGSGGPTAPHVHHEYEGRNGGHATISELELWIEDGEGRKVSRTAGGTLHSLDEINEADGHARLKAARGVAAAGAAVHVAPNEQSVNREHGILQAGQLVRTRPGGRTGSTTRTVSAASSAATRQSHSRARR